MISQNTPTVALIISALLVCPIVIGIVVFSTMNYCKKRQKRKQYNEEDDLLNEEEKQAKQSPDGDGLHDINSINNSNTKMIKGDQSVDLEKAISEIESRHTRDPIQLITPVIPAPTPAPMKEESKEI